MPIQNQPITANTPLTALIAYAKSEAGNLFPEEEFLVKSLFVGYEWERIPKGNRTKLGAAFFTFAKAPGSGLAPLGKTPQNQQRYRKL